MITAKPAFACNFRSSPPSHHSDSTAALPRSVVSTHFSWNYTTFLNFVAVLLFVGTYLAYRDRQRRGSDRYAIDPVCGMQVEKMHAPAHLVHDGHDVWFCSDSCRTHFAKT